MFCDDNHIAVMQFFNVHSKIAGLLDSVLIMRTERFEDIGEKGLRNILIFVTEFVYVTNAGQRRVNLFIP
jgi:hypothetical protein